MYNHPPIGLTGCLALSALSIGGLTGAAIALWQTFLLLSHHLWR